MTETALWWAARAPRSYVTFVGRKIIRFLAELHALGAVAQTVVVCVLIDALFIVIYLVA